MIGDRVHSVGSAAEAIGAYLQNGGLVMPPLVLCVVVLWFAIGWRWVTLNRGGAKSVRVLINNRLRDKPRVLKGIVDTAVNQGVALWAEHKPYLRERLDEAFGHYQSEIKRYSLVVSTIVAIAPLLGLLGTVIGMINTFQLITIFGTGDAKSLSSGISEALMTTALGLIVAIPTLILHGGLSRLAKRKLGQLEEVSVAFLNGVDVLRGADTRR